MTDFARLLQALVSGGVEFIIIGGVAATAHGSAHVTADLDIVYRRTPQNIARLAEALSPLQPYIRGAPPGLPFQFDVETIRRGLNFTLVTVAGDLDAMGEATGGGTYEALAVSSIRIRYVASCSSASSARTSSSLSPSSSCSNSR